MRIETMLTGIVWQQIVEIFAKLKIELPIKVGYDYEYEIPVLEKVYVPKSDTYKWKVPSGFTTNKKALEEMINVMPDNSGIDIIKLLKEYRGKATRCFYLWVQFHR
jgi:hypothetical protein